jgi:translation initiation factor 6 (eIF-6)
VIGNRLTMFNLVVKMLFARFKVRLFDHRVVINSGAVPVPLTIWKAVVSLSEHEQDCDVITVLCEINTDSRPIVCQDAVCLFHAEFFLNHRAVIYSKLNARLRRPESSWCWVGGQVTHAYTWKRGTASSYRPYREMVRTLHDFRNVPWLLS